MKPEEEAGCESKTQESRCSQVSCIAPRRLPPGDVCLRFGGSKIGFEVETLEDITM